MKTIMTEAQAKQILREHEDEDIPEELLAEIFTTLFDRAPNAQDREKGLASSCYRALETEDTD